MILLVDEFIVPERESELTDLGVECVIVGFEHAIDPDFASKSALDPQMYAEWAKANVPERGRFYVLLDIESHDGNLTPEWIDSVNKAVQAIKKVRPNAMVGAYGYPGLTAWVQSTWRWRDLTIDLDAAREEYQKAFDKYAPLLASCDWICPCAYDADVEGQNHDDAAVHYKSRRARLSCDIGEEREVIVALCLYKAPSAAGEPEHGEMLATERVSRRQIAPSLTQQVGGENYIDGFLVWQQETHYTEVAVIHQPSEKQAQLRGVYELAFGLDSTYWAQPDKDATLAGLRGLLMDRTVAVFKAIKQLTGT